MITESNNEQDVTSRAITMACNMLHHILIHLLQLTSLKVIPILDILS